MEKEKEKEEGEPSIFPFPLCMLVKLQSFDKNTGSRAGGVWLGEIGSPGAGPNL